jgi:hypothetical protein
MVIQDGWKHNEILLFFSHLGYCLFAVGTPAEINEVSVHVDQWSF